MSVFSSPGVKVTEIDLSTIIPAASASVGAFAGAFKWGPCEQVVLVSNEADLVARFLAPDIDTQVDFLTAASYLAYSNSLRVVRAFASNALNATSADSATPGAGSGLLVKNADHYTTLTISPSVDWIAKYPGAIGNSLAVVVVPSKDAVLGDLAAKYATAVTNGVLRDINMYGQITSAIGRDFPTTTTYAQQRGASNDEIHVFVVDYKGRFSGVPGGVLESFKNVSMAGDARGADGTSNYYVDAINSRSKYVWWGSHPSTLGASIGSDVVNDLDYKDGLTLTSVVVQPFGGGSNGTVPVGDNDYINAYNFFQAKEIGAVSFIIMGGRGSVPTLNAIQNIAEVRKDCVVFFSPLASDVVAAADPLTNCITYRDNTLTDPDTVRTDTIGGYNSTYAFMDCNWKYMFNKYTNKFVWVPVNGDTAGVAAATDLARAQWYSPAGLNRGLIKNAVKLAWNPTEAQRDDLYNVQINPVVSLPGKGIVLYGDKTLSSKPSAFDRINVRRLFIVLETAISDAAQYSLFELNNQFTRALFVSIVDPFLRDVKGRGGVTDYFVQCNSDNNTGEVIDNNQFVADIYIKPARSINFIRLNFLSVGTSVSFATIVGSQQF